VSKGSIEWEYNEKDGLVLRLKPGLEDLAAAGEVLQHAMSAKKEILLTLKSLIDVAAMRMEKKETPAKKRPTKIKVE
jgi:hypothetical protein